MIAALALSAACAPASRYGTDLGPVAGSTPALQPRIDAATSAQGALQLTFSVPARSYVSFLRVYTQASVAVLAPGGVGTETAMEPTDPGSYKLILQEKPTYIGANARRSGAVVNRADGALAATDSRYPIHDYLVVIATAKPLALEDVQSSLEYVDLRGPDDDVLARIAQAVGSHMLGPWAASVTRPWTGGAPF